MSFIPHYNNMYEYHAPFVPANSVSQTTFSLIQRAQFLQSQGATELNNLELAHIQHQLARLQRSTGSRDVSTTTTTTPATVYPQSMNKDQCVFLPHQLNALKNQIIAYKLLAKNTPLPPQLQQAVLAPSNSLLLAQSSPPMTPVITPKATVHPQPYQDHRQLVPPTPPTPHCQEAHDPTSSPAASLPSQSSSTFSPCVASQMDAYVPPTALLANPITSYAHASRHQNILIPSLLPVGIDPQAIQSAREKRMLARMKQYQYQQPATHVQDHIRSKALKLYQKQSKLRNELVQGVEKSTVLATSAHGAMLRRTKKVSRLDSQQVQAVELAQRQQREAYAQEATHNRLQALYQHGSALSLENRQKQAKLTKLGRDVVHYHQSTAKTEHKKMERVAKARMQALKNDDEEAYLKLLDQAKDTRLTDLLRQTDVFLQSLAASVVEQQQSTGRSHQEQLVQYNVSSDDYFGITHKVHENVSQPASMVGGQLKQYQVRGLQWMVSLYNNNLNGILADEMGLGKTIQTISLITYLIEKKQQDRPFLIIVPLSTLSNWTMEFDKWAPSVSKIVYTGRAPKRAELARTVRSGQFQVLLTTFEYIIRDTQALCRTNWLYLIIDEGHRMKNANAKLTVTLRQKFHARYRLILTGTPLQNNLPELWALLNFVLPKIFKSVKTFEEWFNAPFSNQGVQVKADLNEEEQLLIIKRLHKVLRPFLLRRLKSDVESELPDKVERVIKCRLSSLQAKLYQQLKNTHVNSSSSGHSIIGSRKLNNTIMQLRKVCNHPFVFEGVENALNPSGKANELLYRCSGKFELLDRMLPKLQRTGHRVLIFFQMTSIMDIMEDYLNWRNYRYLRLDGNTRSEDRSTLLEHFNQPDSPYFLFLLSTRAGGLGLNLQLADTVILFDSDWNPHQDLQAQDRAHRIGQTKEVRIFRLVTCDSIEERILATAQYKLDMDGKVIQAGKFDDRSTEADQEALLRTLLEDKTAEQYQEKAWDEDASNQALNSLLTRSDQELSVFEMMDSERRAQHPISQQQQERLIQENELPDVFNVKEDDIVDPVALDLDRSRKAKQNIKYDDGLTDAQFMRAIEGGQFMPYHVEKKRDTPAAAKPSRKRTRVEPEKTPEIDTVSRLVRKQLTEIFEACYARVEKAIAIEDDGYYRKRCELFMDLVDKKDYPDYYTLIKKPISMNMIKQRIHSFYYKNIHEFKSDFAVMFENARIFNEEESAVYEDADEMEKILNNELEKQCPRGILPAYRKRKTAIEQDFIEGPFDEEEEDE